MMGVLKLMAKIIFAVMPSSSFFLLGTISISVEFSLYSLTSWYLNSLQNLFHNHLQTKFSHCNFKAVNRLLGKISGAYDFM